MDAILILLAIGTLAWAGFQSVQLAGGGVFYLWQSTLSRHQVTSSMHQGVATQLKSLQMEARNSKTPKSIWRNLVVANIIQESSDTRSFVLADPSGDRLPPFLSGQHLLVESATRSLPLLRRCYSLSHGPGGGFYQITVKKKEGAQADRSMSVRLHEQIAIGDELRVKGPQGNFVHSIAGQEPIVLLAAGIGITPMLSMLEGIFAERPNASVWLYYQVRDSQHEAFGARLRDLAKKHTQFQLRIFRSRSKPEEIRDQSVFLGKFGIAHIHRELGSKGAHFFMCGPDAWMKQCVEGLMAIGHPNDRVHFESFGSESTTELNREEPLSKNLRSAATEKRPSVYQITFNRSRTQIHVDGKCSLLENALAANAMVDSGCRVGNCGSCVTRLLKGAIRYSRKPECDVSENEIALCVAIPTTDIELDA